MQKEFYDDMYRQEKNYWWYVGRRRLVLALLKNFFDKNNSYLSQQNKFLDVGCGTGVFLQDLDLSGESWGMDYSSIALNYCRKRGLRLLKKADLERKLPFSDNFFNIVTCLDILEHVKNEEAALRELFRILKPGGVIVITVPAYQKLWSYWDEKNGHKRRYQLKELKTKLKKAGFKIQKTSYFNILILPPSVVFRTLKSFLGKDPKKMPTDFIDMPKVINNLLLMITNVERLFVLKTGLPTGLSIVCLAKK